MVTWASPKVYFPHNYHDYSMFCDVPGCSGMFRDVPCSWFYRRPRFASSSSSAPPSGTKNDYAVTHGKMIESSLSDYNDYETAFAIVSFKVGIVLYKTKCFSPNLIAVHLSKNQWSKIYILFCFNFIFPTIMLVCLGHFDVKVSSVPKVWQWYWWYILTYFELFVSESMHDSSENFKPAQTTPRNLHSLLKTKALLHLLITSYFVIEVAPVSIFRAFSKRTDK